jgi:hypothetical protein
VHVVSAAVPSLLFAVADAPGVGVKTGIGVVDTDALGVGLAEVGVTFPAFQSVATNKTIGESRESSWVNLVIPVCAAKTFAASSCDAL